MRMQNLVVKTAILAIFVGLAGCSNWKSETFTSANHEQVLSDSAKNATEDDKRTIAAALVRNAFGAYSVDGKSVSTVIDEQTKFAAEEKAREEAAHEAQLKVEAKRAAILAEIGAVLDVVPVSKGFSPANYVSAMETNEEAHGDKITLDVEFRNKGKKTITAFKGNLVFSNTFGDKIFTVSYDEAEHIRSGQRLAHSGGVHFNTFMEDNVKFRNLALSQMKSRFEASAVSFADGSTLVAPDPQ